MKEHRTDEQGISNYEVMAEFEDNSHPLEDFSGMVRLFPLPNLVLFPHVMQPLHLFEPRYRDLLEEALAGDRLIAMATLAPGWEHDYEGRPPLHPMGCLGRIAASHALEDGSYNVLLLGLSRIRLLDELPPRKTFREAKVQLCDDVHPDNEAAAGGTLQRRLRDAFLRIVPKLPPVQEQLDQLLGSEVPLAVLTDVVSYMLDIDLYEKGALLAELNVHSRAELLLGHLSAIASPSPRKADALVFPPEFSPN